MFSTEDTIVAIATPPGRSGIGVVRLSGPAASAIALSLIARSHPLEARRATLTEVRVKAETTLGRQHERIGSDQTDAAIVDQVVATYFPGPSSYTGEDVVELSAHGSPVILRAIVSAAMTAGARLAEPGEFTLRAFLSGRIDLTQAEAVADLIDSVTPLQVRAAFDQLQGTLTCAIAEIERALFDLVARLEASIDFPEEGYHFIDPQSLAASIDEIIEVTNALLVEGRRGRVVREGRLITIVGRPNVGKSSLFNALVGAARAIVTDVPGTTRDLVTETLDLDGLQVTLVDTAGLRDTSDVIESEGVVRAAQSAVVSDLVLLVLDGSQPYQETDGLVDQVVHNKTLMVMNKEDLGAVWSREGCIRVSATTGSGLPALRARILELLDVDLLSDRPAMTNVRHVSLVGRAHASLLRARTAALAEGGSLSEEFVLADLQDARAALEEVTGRRAPDELLEHIFARFCIGK